MKKVVVNANTNIRISCDDLDIQPIGVIHVGAQIEVEDDLITGASHRDEETGKTANTWYRDKNGWFYWSGEIVPVPADDPPSPPTDFEVNWDYGKKIINIPTEWLASKGAGVKIAILDSGLSLRSNFKNIVKEKCFNCISQNITNDVSGFESHGTAVTTFLASIPDNEQGIRGVAPEADYYFMKLWANNGSVSQASFIRALKLAIEKEVDIITMSQGLAFSGTETQELKDCYNQIISKNILFVCAANKIDTPFNILYPASEPFTLSIGSFKASDFDSGLQAAVENLDLGFPYLPIKTYRSFSGTGREANSASSFAAPLLSGTLALFFAHLKNKAKTNNQPFAPPNLEILKLEIQNTLLPGNTFFDQFNFFNPKNTLT